VRQFFFFLQLVKLITSRQKRIATQNIFWGYQAYFLMHVIFSLFLGKDSAAESAELEDWLDSVLDS
jgi:hypothetical protein